MNQLQNFNFNNLPVRTVLIDDQPWFVAKDVSDILEYDQTSNMLKRLDSEDFISSKLDGMNMKSKLINESGLYDAIIGSKKKETRPFKRWITHEVLPTIRKHGAYMTNEAIEKALTSPDFIIQLATNLKDEQEKTAMLSQHVAESRPKADYYDRIMKSKSLVTISQIAEDYGMSAQALNKMLYELKVQHKVGGQWLLYAKHKNHGYTFSETNVIPNHKDGGEKVVMNTKWTQKGRVFIYNLLKTEGIYPTIERDDVA